MEFLISYYDHTHLAVTSGENSSEDLSVFFHLIELSFQGALHMSVSEYVFDNVFLERPPQRSLIGAVKLEPREKKQPR